jgi:hypothetical protein
VCAPTGGGGVGGSQSIINRSPKSKFYPPTYPIRSAARQLGGIQPIINQSIDIAARVRSIIIIHHRARIVQQAAHDDVGRPWPSSIESLTMRPEWEPLLIAVALALTTLGLLRYARIQLPLGTHDDGSKPMHA